MRAPETRIARCAAALGLLLCAGARSLARAEADVVVVVNGEAVPVSEFESDWREFLALQKKALKPEQMSPQWERSRKEMLLNKIIEQRLILQEAKRRKIEITPRAVDQAVARVKARFASEAAFEKELADENVTAARFREDVANQLRGVALTDLAAKERGRPPTEEQLRAMFEAVKDRMSRPRDAAAPADRLQEEIDAMARDMRLKAAERAELQHILFPLDAGAPRDRQEAVLARAREVRARILKGADFGAMARRYSGDAASAGNGGEAGFVARGELNDRALDDAIFSLPVGGVSDVIRTGKGYEILRVEERRAASTLRFDGARKYLEDNMTRFATQDAWTSELADLWKAAVIERKTDFSVVIQ